MLRRRSASPATTIAARARRAGHAGRRAAAGAGPPSPPATGSAAGALTGFVAIAVAGALPLAVLVRRLALVGALLVRRLVPDAPLVGARAGRARGAGLARAERVERVGAGQVDRAGVGDHRVEGPVAEDPHAPAGAGVQGDGVARADVGEVDQVADEGPRPGDDAAVVIGPVHAAVAGVEGIEVAVVGADVDARAPAPGLADRRRRVHEGARA